MFQTVNSALLHLFIYSFLRWKNSCNSHGTQRYVATSLHLHWRPISQYKLLMKLTSMSNKTCLYRYHHNIWWPFKQWWLFWYLQYCNKVGFYCLFLFCSVYFLFGHLFLHNATWCFRFIFHFHQNVIFVFWMHSLDKLWTQFQRAAVKGLGTLFSRRKKHKYPLIYIKLTWLEDYDGWKLPLTYMYHWLRCQ